MGYCISLSDHSFTIPADLLDLAYVAACELNTSGEATKHGGSSTGAVWFSWVDADYDKTCKDLLEVMEHWRYESVLNDAGDLVLCGFTGEKIGDEDQLFKAIAPFVTKGSFIEFMGEDASQWRFIFDGKTMHEVKPTITWPTVM